LEAIGFLPFTNFRPPKLPIGAHEPFDHLPCRIIRYEPLASA
jgi:hypothetical protein